MEHVLQDAEIWWRDTFLQDVVSKIRASGLTNPLVVTNLADGNWSGLAEDLLEESLDNVTMAAEEEMMKFGAAVGSLAKIEMNTRLAEGASGLGDEVAVLKRQGIEERQTDKQVVVDFGRAEWAGAAATQKPISRSAANG